MTKALEKLSDEELDELGYELQRKRDDIREQQITVNEERSKRARERLSNPPDVAVEGVTASAGATGGDN